MTGGADDLLYCIRHIVDRCVNSNTDGPFLEKIMNAYELADAIDITLGKNVDVLNILKAAVILREQADRIAELEKVLEQEGISVGRDLLNGGIALFKKSQTKPLSDEEIEKTFNNTFKVRDFDGEFLRFARAIEERHGIK